MIEKRFENGLTLLVKENHAAPLVTADIWVHCGSANEPLHLTGVSHFLEHMIFKGSQRLAVGEFDRRIENFGGYLNAGTAQDFTHYFFTLPSRHFDAAFDDLADVVTQAVLDPAEFEKERAVILEEIRRKQDSPMGFLYETVFEQTFAEGPYKHPVLGYPETIQIMSRDQMHKYHAAHYRPENLTVVVVGDIATTQVLDSVSKSLGSLQGDTATPTVEPQPPSQYQWGLRKEYPKDVREAYLAISFPVPGLSQRDERETAAIDLAFTILGGSRASRLWQSIRERQRLVSSISLTDITLRGDSLFVAFATLEPRNLEPAIEAVYREIEAFTEKGPTRRELDRARKTLANHFLFQNETNAGQASTAGYFHTLTGDITFAERYLKALREVSRAEVQEAARQYLDRARSNAFVVVPNSLAAPGDASLPDESNTP